MLKNPVKIHGRTAAMLLAIIVSSLLNICLFTFQAKAAPIQQPKLAFAYDDGGHCVIMPITEPEQTINRPTAPMPECCLARSRYYDAIINTANDKSAPAFSTPIILSANDFPLENNSAFYTARLTYPPPQAPALASIVIRE